MMEPQMLMGFLVFVGLVFVFNEAIGIIIGVIGLTVFVGYKLQQITG